jgi:hypothetical protein
MRWEETLLPGHLVYHAFRRVGPMSGPLPSGEEAVSFDVYWMHLRDGEARADTNYPALLERIEGALGLDDYDVTALHTVGTRGSGTFGAFDWQAEVAFQWGEADAIGARFPFNGGLYGDDTARWDAWAGNGEIGITLAGQPWTPRIYAGGAWYGGEDHRGISFAQWVNPFDRPRASVSFHRIFSSWREDAFIDGSAMTNFWKAYAGVTALPADRLRIDALVTYLEVIEPFDTPLAVDIGHWRVPVAPGLPFLARAGSKNLGWQTGLWAVYQYSDDLSFEAGWSHYFVGDAVDDGAFIDENGLTFIGGRGSEDADYLYLYTVLEF